MYISELTPIVSNTKLTRLGSEAPHIFFKINKILNFCLKGPQFDLLFRFAKPIMLLFC